MSGHTPGKWRLATPDELTDANEYRPHIVADGANGPLYVAAVYDSLDEHTANAALIASAPEQQAKIDALAAALRSRGVHADGCRSYFEIGRIGSRSGQRWNAGDEKTCTCEFGAALALARSAP